MSLKQARATGWVGALDRDLSEGSACQRYLGHRGVESVYFETTTGRLIIIAVDRSIRTDKGVGVGDTYRQLHARYPDADGGEGRLYAVATSAPIPASYRFGTSGGSVIFPDDTVKEIALQAKGQPCYE